jgi:hypothetical protein
VFEPAAAASIWVASAGRRKPAFTARPAA